MISVMYRDWFRHVISNSCNSLFSCLMIPTGIERIIEQSRDLLFRFKPVQKVTSGSVFIFLISFLVSASEFFVFPAAFFHDFYPRL